MKVADSSINLWSRHLAAESRQVQESLRITAGGRSAQPVLSAPVTVQLRAMAQAQTAQLAARPAPAPAARTKPAEDDEAVSADPKLELVRRLLEKVTGRKFKLARLESFEAKPAAAAPAPAAAANAAGAGVAYDRVETTYEMEATAFKAQGSVTTEDGREIQFDLELAMEREHTHTEEVHLRLGTAAQTQDPLVLNFDGRAVQLQSATFSFDLDADGRAEQVAALAPGSGFLVRDANGDGKIVDGRELFGPVTGNGFNELEALDADGNRWIDEQDPAYQQLGVWNKTPDGSETLASLNQAGVGAIYLGREATPFTVKDGANEMLGQVRETGIFLEENGMAGSIQEVDLRV